MRILFLESHPMWINGLPNGFRDAGHIVKISGPLTKSNISEMILEFKPDLIFNIGWTNENTGEKIYWIQRSIKASKVPFIYWATEDPGYTHSFSLPLIQRISPNFVFTICPSRVDYYKKIGFKSALLEFGYHKDIHYRTERLDKYSCSIAVVANGYPIFLTDNKDHFRLKSLKTLIKPLLKDNLRVDFWGRYWDQMSPLVECEIPKDCIHGYLTYTEANKVYSSADIVIGLQNRTDQLTQRTYEILGSEGFLVTSDTDEVKRVFKPNHDLIVSSSPEETLQLVKYYLSNPTERERIRTQGRAAVNRYSYTARAEYVIKTLKKENII